MLFFTPHREHVGGRSESKRFAVVITLHFALLLPSLQQTPHYYHIMSTIQTKYASEIAEKYGPYLTKAMKGEGIDDLQSLFASSVFVTLQDGKGDEILFSIGSDDNASMTWTEFQQTTAIDVVSQNYEKTESVCLGVLGNRLIMEVARVNTAGEVYLVAYNLVEFSEEGKIVEFESFSDLQTTSLTG